MWPQSSLDEVVDGQESADLGDPVYAWQVDAQLFSAGDEWWAHLRDEGGSEIVERFLRDELGWEAFLFNPYFSTEEAGGGDGTIGGIAYLRCAPGETNSLYPIAPIGHQEAPGAELCAPTIGQFKYEMVQFNLSQLARQGSAGMWVVTDWTITAPFTQVDPLPVETEAIAHLEDFLRARIAGVGAEGYVQVNGTFESTKEVPLLYTTADGSPYERFEIEHMNEPLWPSGDMQFTVRLFADGDETVIEQLVSLMRVNGETVFLHEAASTTANGEPYAVPLVFFEGEKTARRPCMATACSSCRSGVDRQRSQRHRPEL